MAAELRLNLWIELGWYAEMENWDEGWANLAFKELQQNDKWWIITGQYKSIEYWLDKFSGFNAKEEILYDYKHNPIVY